MLRILAAQVDVTHDSVWPCGGQATDRHGRWEVPPACPIRPSLADGTALDGSGFSGLELQDGCETGYGVKATHLLFWTSDPVQGTQSLDNATMEGFFFFSFFPALFR